MTAIDTDDGWYERMAARAASRQRQQFNENQAAAYPDAWPVTQRLREQFLAARPDLPPEYRQAILAAPTVVYERVEHSFDVQPVPYDPADYRWSEAEVRAAASDECCWECYQPTPPEKGRPWFGWTVHLVCNYLHDRWDGTWPSLHDRWAGTWPPPKYVPCDHEHHKDEVWLA
jgi:hypothetical protein